MRLGVGHFLLAKGDPTVIFGHAWPVVMDRKKRSLVSSTRRQVIASGSMFRRTNLRSHHFTVSPR